MKKKSRIKTYTVIAVLLVITLILAFLPTLAGKNVPEEGNASILQMNVQRRDINQVVSAGGFLTAQEAEILSIPQGVDVIEFLVKNGEQVNAKDVIARVDKVSVMSAVTQVQDTLNTLNEACAELQPDIKEGAIYVSTDGEIFVEGNEVEPSEYEVYSEYLSLAEQHRIYEEMMLELFQLYQNPEIIASCDGTVYGLDDSIVKKLSSEGSFSIVLLSNVPVESDANSYTNYVGMVESISDGTMYMKMNPTSVEVEDYGNLDSAYLNTQAMTESVTYSSGIAVYCYNGSAWEQLDTIQSGDILLFACNGNSVVWAVNVGRSEQDVPNPPTESETPTEAEPPTESEPPTEPETPIESETPTEVEPPTESEPPTKPETSTESETPMRPASPGTGQGGYPSGGNTGDQESYPDSGNTGIQGNYADGEYANGGNMGNYSTNGGQTQAEAELYSTTHITVCGITPQKTMTLSINVDEQDISDIMEGMEATVTLDALPGQHFTGIVRQIMKTGTNAGGSSKFDVEIELPYQSGMLPGMNAGVVIVIDTTSDALVVPVAALNDEGGKTYVYTGYDEKNEVFIGKTEVSIGVSDGEYVQIREGLSENTVIWYSFYNAPDLPIFSGDEI